MSEKACPKCGGPLNPTYVSVSSIYFSDIEECVGIICLQCGWTERMSDVRRQLLAREAEERKRPKTLSDIERELEILRDIERDARRFWDAVFIYANEKYSGQEELEGHFRRLDDLRREWQSR